MPAKTAHFPTDHHGWSELLPERVPNPALSGSHRVDWCVVGAGLTGLACARRLAQLHPHASILLLEARAVGQGASGRNSGFVVATSQFNGGFEKNQIAHYQRINRINQTGLELLGEVVKSNSIDCDWCREGFIHTATDQAALREYDYYRQYLEALEVPHQLFDIDVLAAKLGTRFYRVGIRIEDGALVQPAALVRGLARTLPQNISLHEQSPVIDFRSGQTVKIFLPNAEVVTDRMVVATNYEAPKLGLIGSRIMGSTLAGSFTRQLEPDELGSLGELEQWGAISLHSGGATVRLTADGRISLRNTAEYHGARLLDDALLRERQKIHREAFEKRFPQLVDVPFEFSWSGVEGISRNGTSFFGEQMKNVYLAGGYNGSGVSRGTAFGTAIADYASGEQTQTVSDCLAFEPAGWIPPRPFLDIGAWYKIRSRFRDVGLDR